MKFVELLILIAMLFTIAYANPNAITTSNQSSIITRDEWGSYPRPNVLGDLRSPVNRVIITHSVTPGCDTKDECIDIVRMIQRFHMDVKLWYDIGYNFLIGGDGNVYEGRGWNFEGAHTRGYNAKSIGVTFIGTFTKISPPQQQFDALQALLDEGVKSGNLTRNFNMYPQRAFFGTESPGEQVVKVIKSWPNYIGTLTVSNQTVTK